MPFQTEYEFTLPKGYLDEDGILHKRGTMRLATEADERLSLEDPRAQNNPAYSVIVLLSRVVTRLGDLERVTTNTIERLYAADIAYLQEFYNQINRTDSDELVITCPNCSHTFKYTVYTIDSPNNLKKEDRLLQRVSKFFGLK